MLTDGNVQHVVKHSMAYGFALSQPFSFYVDAYPMLQNEVLTEGNALYYGQHNEAVRVLQHKLNELSYYDKTIDGDFGILTEHALKKFQYEHELFANGQANRETINELIKSEREKYLEPLKSIDQTYHPGEKGEEIKTIQEALYYFGYYTTEIDGIYGPMTDQALKSFQKDHGLEVEEEVNEKTIDAIYSAEQASEENNNKTKPEQTVEKKEEEKTPKKMESVPNQQNYDASQLIRNAKEYINTPYVWGGTSPSGFDCSGFIQYAFSTVGISVPRTVSDIWNMSKPVEKLSVGDLVFFETYKPGPSHMGIYLGDSKFIHAGSSTGVEIDDMNLSYWSKRYLGAKRVVSQN